MYQGIPQFTLEEIRSFFARRPFARPPDWESINALRPMTKDRQHILSALIFGYSLARPAHLNQGFMSKLDNLVISKMK